jgi:hypothetical protein
MARHFESNNHQPWHATSKAIWKATTNHDTNHGTTAPNREATTNFSKTNNQTIGAPNQPTNNQPRHHGTPLGKQQRTMARGDLKRNLGDITAPNREATTTFSKTTTNQTKKQKPHCSRMISWEFMIRFEKT